MYGSKISDKFEMIVEVDLAEPDYSYDVLGIWKAEDGYYLSTDSGCSCYSPWESHSDADLTGPLTAEQAIEEATSLWIGSYQTRFEPESFAKAMALIV